VPKAAHPIYVVDDDPEIHGWIETLCRDHDLSCRPFGDGDEFLAAAAGLVPGCVLLDMRMPKKNGLQVQEELVHRGIAMPVVAMTGYGDIDVAVQSMRLGAIDFLEKPFAPSVLFEALTRAFSELHEGPKRVTDA
jgi:two-component system response regulator FixJ